MNDELLFENEWIQVKERDDWYTFVHNIKTEGKAIMVLVYDFDDPENLKLLARYEHNPAHTEGTRSEKDPKYEMTSITGGFEPDMTIGEVQEITKQQEDLILLRRDE